MGIEPTNYPCDAGCATLTIQLGYSVSTQTNCIPLHYLSMSASSLSYRNTLISWLYGGSALHLWDIPFVQLPGILFTVECVLICCAKKLNLRVVPPILSEPFTLLYKAGKVSVRYLGVLQMIRQLYTDLPTSRASNPHPFTVSVVRTNLNSVTSLANTYKTWRPIADSNRCEYRERVLS